MIPLTALLVVVPVMAVILLITIIGTDPIGDAVRELAEWTAGAALVYVPLCLWEIRMSPQLHRQLYGFHTFENFGFAVRWGGYRPTVFMQFGLMVGTFMGTGALVAYWLWRTRSGRKLLGLSMGQVAVVLAVTTVLVKSTGSIILLAVGIGLLEATRALRTPVFVLVVALLAVSFLARYSRAACPIQAGILRARRRD